jgi:hypothetical protein
MFETKIFVKSTFIKVTISINYSITVNILLKKIISFYFSVIGVILFMSQFLQLPLLD